MFQYTWSEERIIERRSFVCGHCSHKVGSDRGFSAQYWEHSMHLTTFAYICPNCTKLTFFDAQNRQDPGPIVGSSIKHLPSPVEVLWAEARLSFSSSAFTASAMVCRVLLMHIAVEKEAKEDQTFAYYVDWLYEKGYIPPGAKDVIDEVRKIGNTANHDLVLIDKETAERAILLIEHVLKSVYELPGPNKAST